MKTEYYGTYALSFDESQVRLDYTRTPNDYWNLFFRLGLIGVLGYYIFSLIMEGLPSHETPMLNLLLKSIPGMLGFWIYKTKRSFFYLLSAPTKNLIHLEKESKILRIKLPGFKEYLLMKEELLRIEYELEENHWSFSQAGATNYSVNVFIRTKDRKRSHFLFIKESAVWDWEESERKRKILRLSKNLNKRLAQLLNITAKRIKSVKEAS